MENVGWLRLDVSGELSSVAYLLMASWANPATEPLLRRSAGPLQVLIEPSLEALDELARALRVIGSRHEALARSAAVLLGDAERQFKAFSAAALDN